MAKTEKKIDRRKLPVDQRPKPTTGQSAPARELPWDSLNGDEREVVQALATDDRRQPRSVAWMADAFDAEKDGTIYDPAKLKARNALRRLVQGGWVVRKERGTYQLTEPALKRYRRAMDRPKA